MGRWEQGIPAETIDICPVGLCPSLSRTVCMAGSAGSIACSSLNGFKLVDLIRALLLYPRAHPGAGGDIPVCSGMCLQSLWGFIWSASDGNVCWFNARKFRLFFQDLAPKAG